MPASAVVPATVEEIATITRPPSPSPGRLALSNNTFANPVASFRRLLLHRTRHSASFGSLQQYFATLLSRSIMDRDLPLYDVQLARLRDLKRQQRLRRLIYFRLESDSMPNRASPTDLWIPKLRKYESTPEGTVQHLDEISMWRNLSPAQAKEILFWEKMLAAVLEYIVSNHLIDMIDELGLENHFAGTC